MSLVNFKMLARIYQAVCHRLTLSRLIRGCAEGWTSISYLTIRCPGGHVKALLVVFAAAIAMVVAKRHKEANLIQELLIKFASPSVGLCC